MKNKQTAVQWLMMQLPVFIRVDLYEKELYQQAKAMEKEQMIEFANKVLYNAECSFTGRAYLEKGIDEIYNETYDSI